MCFKKIKDFIEKNFNIWWFLFSIFFSVTFLLASFIQFYKWELQIIEWPVFFVPGITIFVAILSYAEIFYNKNW